MPAIWTNAGTAYLTERLGQSLGDLYLTPGTGAYTVDATRDVVAQPVSGPRPPGITFPGGNILALPVTAVDLVLSGGVVTYRRFRVIDSDATRTYDMSEAMVWAVKNNLAFGIVYWADRDNALPKVANSTVEIPVLVAMSGLDNASFTITNTIAGLGDASTTRKGGVQHVATQTSAYTQGEGFVLTPAQAQALAGDSIDEGTRVVSSTGALTFNDNRKLIVANNSGTITLTLPNIEADDVGKYIGVTKFSSGNVVIDGHSSDNVGSGTQITLTRAFETVVLRAITTSRWVIQSHANPAPPTVTVPTAASSSELNAGTDSSKFATASALEDSQYKRVVQTTQTAYDNLATKDSDVLYVIPE